MSAFTLHRQAYSQGAFTVCYVRQEGGSRQRYAHAHFSIGRLGEFAIVTLPAHAVTVNPPPRDPDWIDDTSGRVMWDFSSHQDAIDFLCHLYGIATAEDAEGQPLEASADTLNRVLRTVPAFPLLRRDAIHTAPLFWGRGYPHPDHPHPRNRQ